LVTVARANRYLSDSGFLAVTLHELEGLTVLTPVDSNKARWHVAYWQIVLQKYFEHFDEKY